MNTASIDQVLHVYFLIKLFYSIHIIVCLTDVKSKRSNIYVFVGILKRLVNNTSNVCMHALQ